MEDLRPVLRERTNVGHDSHSADAIAINDHRDMMRNVIAHLDEINKTFDESYKEITELLGQIADNAVATHTDRTDRFTDLKEDLREWMERTAQAKQKSRDVEDLLERQRYVQQMEIERTDLIQEILAGTEELERLKQKNEEFKQKMEHLQQLAEALKTKKAEEIPTYQFLRKIFRQVSETKIVNSDGNVLEGFVSKTEKNEVLPFRYDRTKPTFERVNDLWNKISE